MEIHDGSNSLHCRFKHARKERKEEVILFKQQLQKLRQELKDGEKTWSEVETKFSEKVVQMTKDLRKLRVEVEERSRETEQLKTELAKKDNGTKELQTQLEMTKMKVQVQYKQLSKRKEVMAEANKQITHLVEQRREGPWKTTLHLKKLMEKFRKQTEEDIEIATATTLQEWCGQAT